MEKATENIAGDQALDRGEPPKKRGRAAVGASVLCMWFLVHEPVQESISIVVSGLYPHQCYCNYQML